MEVTALSLVVALTLCKKQRASKAVDPVRWEVTDAENDPLCPTLVWNTAIRSTERCLEKCTPFESVSMPSWSDSLSRPVRQVGGGVKEAEAEAEAEQRKKRCRRTTRRDTSIAAAESTETTCTTEVTTRSPPVGPSLTRLAWAAAHLTDNVAHHPLHRRAASLVLAATAHSRSLFLPDSSTPPPDPNDLVQAQTALRDAVRTNTLTDHMMQRLLELIAAVSADQGDNDRSFFLRVDLILHSLQVSTEAPIAPLHAEQLWQAALQVPGDVGTLIRTAAFATRAQAELALSSAASMVLKPTVGHQAAEGLSCQTDPVLQACR